MAGTRPCQTGGDHCSGWYQTLPDWGTTPVVTNESERKSVSGNKVTVVAMPPLAEMAGISQPQGWYIGRDVIIIKLSDSLNRFVAFSAVTLRALQTHTHLTFWLPGTVYDLP